MKILFIDNSQNQAPALTPSNCCVAMPAGWLLFNHTLPVTFLTGRQSTIACGYCAINHHIKTPAAVAQKLL